VSVGTLVGKAQRGTAPVRPMGRILELITKDGQQYARVGSAKMSSVWPTKLLAVVAV
jgi:hypothetical protein